MRSLKDLKEGLSKNLVPLSEILGYVIGCCDDETVKDNLESIYKFTERIVNPK
jgi:hypothetical protein